MRILETLAFGEHGGVVLLTSSGARPREEDWRAYVDFVREQRRKLGSKPLLAIAVGRGDGPTSAQRQALADATSGHPVRVAVLVDGVVARGVVTALSWFNPGYAAFPLDGWVEAVRHLGISGALGEELRARARDAEQSLGRKR